MSSVLHVWHAAPLPLDADSAHDDWRATRDRGRHEPRLLRCLARLEAALADHDPDMVWTEVPEAVEPCAVLALAPSTGSLELVTEAILAAAAAEGLCVLNPFDDSVWLPDGRVRERLSLVPLDAAPRPAAPAAPAPAASTPAASSPAADDPAVAEALRGDAPLAAYLLRQWAPLFRSAGFQVRPRPTTEHAWCTFNGQVLRAEVNCSVRHSAVSVSVWITSGGTTMLPALQTEFGCGQLKVDLVALAQAGGVVAPDAERPGVTGPDFVRHLAATGGDPRRMATQWADLFQLLLRWLQPLDDIQALARAVHDPASPLLWLPRHPVDGLLLGGSLHEVTALLAQRPGAVLGAYRRVALMESTHGRTQHTLRDILPQLQVPLGLVCSSVRTWVLWQGAPGASDPLAELQQRQEAPDADVPDALQLLLDFARARHPPTVDLQTGPWAEQPPAVADRPWLTLAYATNADGTLRGTRWPDPQADLVMLIDALRLGLTAYSPQDRCVWTPDGRLHTPAGVVSLGPPEPPPLQAGQAVGRVQEFLGVRAALAPVLAARGFRPGPGDQLFVKAHALGLWRVFMGTLGSDGVVFAFTPRQPPRQGDRSRMFNAASAVAQLGALCGQAPASLPAAVQLATTSPERFARALDRLLALLQLGALPLLDRLDDPAACAAWVDSTAR